MIFNKKIMGYGLLSAIALQVLVLAMVYGGAVYPIITGQEIRLKTTPVDPRSLFRGNYARLNYEISRLDAPDINRAIRTNEVVYVKLKQDKNGLYIADGVSLEKPSEGLFILGRNESETSGSLRIRYGIEAFFAPKTKALALEKALRNKGVAVVMLASNGKATLQNVIPQE